MWFVGIGSKAAYIDLPARDLISQPHMKVNKDQVPIHLAGRLGAPEDLCLWEEASWPVGKKPINCIWKLVGQTNHAEKKPWKGLRDLEKLA